jgi:hypothetical protein
MLAYLIERRLSCGEWQVVGWFECFQPAMSIACSLEPARLRVVDLEPSEVEAERSSDSPRSAPQSVSAGNSAGLWVARSAQPSL